MNIISQPKAQHWQPGWSLARLALGLIGLVGSTVGASAHITGQSVDQSAPGWPYLLAVGAAIVVSLLTGAYFLGQRLTEKPWLPAQGLIDNQHVGSTFTQTTPMLGLRVFLAIVTVLFALFSLAYADRMEFADWRAMPEPRLLWLNTFVLILSSVAMRWAQIGARRKNLREVQMGLLAGGITAVAFLLGQLVVWRQLSALGFYAATNPANAFFYVITAAHGLHILGGLVGLGRTTARVWGHDPEPAKVRQGVELCALYWHFLLVIWLILFALLLLT